MIKFGERIKNKQIMKTKRIVFHVFKEIPSICKQPMPFLVTLILSFKNDMIISFFSKINYFFINHQCVKISKLSFLGSGPEGDEVL